VTKCPLCAINAALLTTNGQPMPPFAFCFVGEKEGLDPSAPSPSPNPPSGDAVTKVWRCITELRAAADHSHTAPLLTKIATSATQTYAFSEEEEYGWQPNATIREIHIVAVRKSSNY
jgi:hypothetical protein